MIIYLSGPIDKNVNRKRDFARAERKLKHSGFTVVNPLTVIPELPFKNIDAHNKIARMWVEECDGIFMMCGWTASEECLLEYRHARTTHKSIMFEDGAEEGE